MYKIVHAIDSQQLRKADDLGKTIIPLNKPHRKKENI